MGPPEAYAMTDTAPTRIAWLSACLAACFHESDGNKAVGIDGVSIDPGSHVNGFVLSLLP
jgi:kynurenine formamidase